MVMVLYPRRRVRAAQRPMSALGHKRTFAVQKRMSALPPKADMCGATREIRLVPIADILTWMEAAGSRGRFRQ